MKEIIENSSHQCVKVAKLQCAGHMLMTKEHNSIMKWLYSWGLRAKLSGQELIFKDKNACITYHKNQEDAELELHNHQTPGEDDFESDPE